MSSNPPPTKPMFGVSTLDGRDGIEPIVPVLSEGMSALSHYTRQGSGEISQKILKNTLLIYKVLNFRHFQTWPIIMSSEKERKYDPRGSPERKRSRSPPASYRQAADPMKDDPSAVVTSRSLFLGTVPIGTISPFLVPIWSLFYQTGPYSAKIVVQSRNIILAMTHWQLMPSDWSTN